MLLPCRFLSGSWYAKPEFYLSFAHQRASCLEHSNFATASGGNWLFCSSNLIWCSPLSPACRHSLASNGSWTRLSSTNGIQRPPSRCYHGTAGRMFEGKVRCIAGVSREQKHHEEGVVNDPATAENELVMGPESKEAQFVHWFREGSPYIQGHRCSIFVLVLPGEVTVNNSKMDGILQDVLLLHGLGVKLVIIPGTHVQVDQLLVERGQKPQYSGAYRVTDPEALAAAMEAAGRVRVAIEAKLSRGPAIPILRRHGDSDRWHEVSIASGNFLAAKRRGVVNGVDFGATGEVKRIDIARIRERLDSNCIVMMTNLGYSASGEVLNCNTYEVATACSIALQADKMLCLLDGPILDDDRRLVRFMTLQSAEKLLCERTGQSSGTADCVKAMTEPNYIQSSGLEKQEMSGVFANSASDESTRRNGGASTMVSRFNTDSSSILPLRPGRKINSGGLAVRGEERVGQADNYLPELTAAVFVCINGVRRVHLLDSNVQGVLLLELYTRDGVGTMISSDMYEGTRAANYGDIRSIMELLRPLEESGALVNRPRKQLVQEFQNYTVVERDGSIIACAALLQYHDDKCGEVAAFAVAPECRGNGQGDALLDYIEKRAVEMKLERLFLLTTRTADWFVQRGFSSCTVDRIPQERRAKIDYKRGAKYYEKRLDHSPQYHSPRR